MSLRLLLTLPLLALVSCETYPEPGTYSYEPIEPARAGGYSSSSSTVRRTGSTVSSSGTRRNGEGSGRISSPETSPQGVDVYRSQSEIRGLHRVIGEVRLSTDGRQAPQAIRSSFEREARSRNAQGVIIHDPADRSYSGGSGPTFEDPREITATFIRYDDRRSGGGYGGGNSSPYSGSGSSYPPY